MSFDPELAMRALSFLAVATTAIVSACASGSSSASSSPSPSGSASASASAPLGKPLIANIVPTGATTSRMSGTITMAPLDAGTYSVTMEFRSAPTNKQLPWSIRPGACGDNTPNSDLGSRSAYGPIQTQADGQAHVNTRLKLQLPAGQTVHVDIMQSNTQRDVILACGLLMAR